VARHPQAGVAAGGAPARLVVPGKALPCATQPRRNPWIGWRKMDAGARISLTQFEQKNL
jgi:hypothetical protein